MHRIRAPSPGRFTGRGLFGSGPRAFTLGRLARLRGVGGVEEIGGHPPKSA